MLLIAIFDLLSVTTQSRSAFQCSDTSRDTSERPVDLPVIRGMLLFDLWSLFALINLVVVWRLTFTVESLIFYLIYLTVGWSLTLVSFLFLNIILKRHFNHFQVTDTSTTSPPFSRARHASIHRLSISSEWTSETYLNRDSDSAQWQLCREWKKKGWVSAPLLSPNGTEPRFPWMSKIKDQSSRKFTLSRMPGRLVTFKIYERLQPVYLTVPM